MKLTVTQLRNIIREEVTNKKAALAKRNRALKEGTHMGGALYDMDSAKLIAFADLYVSLGRAVQEQLVILLDEQEEADCNPNAVKLMRENLYGQNAEIDTAIEAWESANGISGDAY